MGHKATHSLIKRVEILDMTLTPIGPIYVALVTTGATTYATNNGAYFNQCFMLVNQ